MIGNDVVDFEDPETRKKQLHPRFDQRIFSEQELHALAQSDDPHRLRWAMWAAKEASYKCGRKQVQNLIFSPRQFVVLPQDDARLHVRHPQFDFEVELQMSAQRVHALARCSSHCNSHQNALTAVLKVSPTQQQNPSQSIRYWARHCLAPYVQISAGDLSIVTADKIPYLQGPDHQILGDLSLSHHGRFLAFAFKQTPVR